MISKLRTLELRVLGQRIAPPFCVGTINGNPAGAIAFVNFGFQHHGLDQPPRNPDKWRGAVSDS